MSWRVCNLVKSKVLGKTAKPDGRPCSPIIRKIVLLAYADVAAHDGSGVFVAKKTVAAEHEISRQSVVTATQSLLDDGLIEIDDRQYPMGRKPGREGYTIVYRIVIARVRQLPDVDLTKSQNLDTLDSSTIDGDELAEQYSAAVRGPVDKWAKVSRRQTLKASKSPGQSVHPADMNLPNRTSNRPELVSAHRRADPDYTRDVAKNGGAALSTEQEIAAITKTISTLRWDLTVAQRGDKVIGGEFGGMSPPEAVRRIPERISQLELQIASMRGVG